jgi:serine protease Do
VQFDRIFRHVIVASVVVVDALAQTATRAPDRTLVGISRSFEQTVEQVSPTVVQIIARDLAPDDDSVLTRMVHGQRSSGSGVIVDPDGYIVTNAHVVGFARRVQVILPLPADKRVAFKSVLKPAGKLVPAQVIGADRETDLAVLKIDEKGLKALRFADSENLRQGQLVFALGSPFGLENTVTMGVVSSPARQIRPDHPMIYVQTDAPINPGNSGGPLVDADAQLVGINTFIVSTSGTSGGVGFAAPSNIVRSVYEQIRRNGRVRRGQIGIQAQTITPELARLLKLGQDWGVIVGDVRPGGSAEAAGIQIRDILLTLDGKHLENARQFGVNIYQRAGETVKIELLRGEDRLTKEVAVLERPKDTDQMLSMVNEDTNLIKKLGVLALTLDGKTTPLLPTLRRLSGVVVAGVVSDPSGRSDALFASDVIYAVDDTPVSSFEDLQKALQTAKAGESVVLQVERLGQLQFLVMEVQ